MKRQILGSLAGLALASTTFLGGAAQGATSAPTMPTLLLPNITVSEGASGTAAFLVNVGLSAPNPLSVPVTVDAVNYTATQLPDGSGTYGTATPGIDYVAFSHVTLTFQPGQQVATFPVRLKGDRTLEGDEQVDVRFDNTIFNVGDNDIDLVIANDDTGAALTKKPLLSLPNQAMPEPDSGCFPYKVSTLLDRPAPTTRTVDAVDFSAVLLPDGSGTYGTAEPGSDYVGFGTRTLTFNASSRVANLPVTICGDTDPEADEQVDVRFDNTTTIAIGDNDIDLLLANTD